MEQNKDTILYVSFNQDSSCFAIGTETGFKIYNTYPFKLNFSRNLDGGIGIVEMLYRSNILALVGGGTNPKYSQNKVILWDDNQKKSISELKFGAQIKNVKIKKDKIIITCEQRIYVFNFQSFKNIDTFDTCENAKGIIACSQDKNNTVIGYPDKNKGYIRIKAYEKNYTSFINAHESSISFLALNPDGMFVSTASDNGTLIRIFQTQTGEFLQELRRGTDKVEIHFICFDQTSKFLSATSNKGTIHLWSLNTGLKKLQEDYNEVNDNNNNKKEKEPINSNNDSIINNDNLEIVNVIPEIPENKSSIFKGLPNFFIGGFFKSEWSYAQLRIHEPKAICSFCKNNKFIAITLSGNYYQSIIDLKKSGDMQIEFKSVLYASDNNNNNNNSENKDEKLE